MSVSRSLSNFGLGRKLSIQISKILIIVICWLVVGLLVTLYDHFLLSSEMSTGYAEGFSFQKDLVFNLAAAFMGSLLGSAWLVFYVNERLRDKPYGFNLLMVALSFFVIVAFIAFVLGMISVKYEAGYWPFETDMATSALYKNLTNPFHLKNILVWSSIVLLTQLGLQINDKFGQGMLWSFIIGKYHRSRKEQRIFMFADLIGSTYIAEQLGNDKYYGLLKDFFADITDSIIYNGGNIYQYVGDEVVISWECDEKTIRLEFLNCYFDMRKKIKVKKEKYLKKYGLVPDFKAAIHYGDVTVGEIGIIKRELTFSGDVLNTASRMLGFCKEYKKDILISEKLLNFIAPANGNFEYVPMGEEQLRGKSEKTKIYTVFEN